MSFFINPYNLGIKEEASINFNDNLAIKEEASINLNDNLVYIDTLANEGASIKLSVNNDSGIL